MPDLSDAGSATEWGRKDGAPGVDFCRAGRRAAWYNRTDGTPEPGMEADMGEMQFPLPLESEKEAAIRAIMAILPRLSVPFLTNLEYELSAIAPEPPRPSLRLLPCGDGAAPPT